MEGLGAGIASLAFWGFIASVVVGGIWYALRERQAQYETLRSLIESGQKVDEDIVNRVLGGSKRLDRDLRIAAYIVLSAAPGIAICGYLVSLLSEPWLFPMLGVAVLVGFVGIGLLVAAKVAERAKSDDDVASVNRSMVR